MALCSLHSWNLVLFSEGGTARAYTASHTYLSPRQYLMPYLAHRALEITCIMNKDQMTLTCTQKRKQMLFNAEPTPLGTPFPECGQNRCDGKENTLCSPLKSKPPLNIKHGNFALLVVINTRAQDKLSDVAICTVPRVPAARPRPLLSLRGSRWVHFPNKT